MGSVYLDEIVKLVEERLAVLVSKGFDIDLSFVDLRKTAELIFRNEPGDFMNAETPEEFLLAEMKGLMRAIYLNGAPVFSFDCLDENRFQCREILKMAILGDNNLNLIGEDNLAPLSKSQVKRTDMILSPASLHEGQWLMIYQANVPTKMVRVERYLKESKTLICREWGKSFGIKQPGWLGKSTFSACGLGMLPYSNNLWEAVNWAEELDSQEHEMK